MGLSPYEVRSYSFTGPTRSELAIDADEIAEELWKAMPGNINTFINTRSVAD